MNDNEKILRASPDLQDVLDKICDHILGFVGIEDDAYLIGSGTLVSIELERESKSIKAILTAGHVLGHLPVNRPIGLAFPTRFGPYLDSPRIQLEHTIPISIWEGESDPNQPDLGLLVLPDPIASVIPSTKTFYNLSKRRDKILHNPEPIFGSSTWLLSGAAAEWTEDGPPERDFERVKNLLAATGASLVEKEEIIGGFDYLELDAIYDENYDGPQNFGGYSGGSLWHVPATRKGDTVTVTDCILSGVICWQSRLTDSKRIIRCHGRKSIYKHLIDKVESVMSAI